MLACLLAAVGLVGGLGLAECLARLAEAVHCVDREPVFAEPNRFYGWSLISGTEGWGQRCLGGRIEWRAYSRINDAGLRDRDIPYAREGGFRVLFLGDSFVEAHQVAVEQGVAKRLERALETNPSVSHPVEVINAGTSAWGTDNELFYYRHEGWKYRADLVLLAFFTGNDVMENSHALIATRGVAYPEKPYFDLVHGRLVVRDYPLPPEPATARIKRRVRRFLHRHLALYRLFLTMKLPAEASAGAPPSLAASNAQLGVCLKTYPASWREAWRITRRLVLRLRREVEAQGSRFAVVVINDRIEIADDYWEWVFSGNPELDPRDFDRDKPDRLITTFLVRHGIHAIPLRAAFRERFGKTGTPGFFSWDGHWDVAGHALAAEVIDAALGRMAKGSHESTRRLD